MTPLVAVIAAVLVVVVIFNLISRARVGRRDVRSHHRALDTLGHISNQRGVDDHRRQPEPTGPTPRPYRQAHVRVVSADAETMSAPKPTTGGWRPTRATGAAPFRRPASERHDLWDDPETAARTSDAIGAAPVTVPSGVDKVRIVSGLDPGTDGEAQPDGDAWTDGEAQPDGDVWTDGEAQPDGDPWSETEAGAAVEEVPDDPTGRNPVLVEGPRPGPDAGASGPAAPRGEAPMSFDDTGSGPAASGAPAPRHRPRGVPAGATVSTPPRPDRTNLAALARVPAARTGRSHRRRSSRRGPARARALGAVLIVLVVAGVAVGADALLRSSKHPAHVAARAIVHHRRHNKTPTAAVVTTPTTAVALRLVSSAPGSAVYQLAGAQQITLKANAPCWTEIRHGNDTGAIVYSETMAAGTVETVTGSVWIRLGNPTGVAVTVGGAAVSPPVTSGEPYDLEFE